MCHFVSSYLPRADGHYLPSITHENPTDGKADDGNKGAHTSRLTGPCLLIEVNQKPIWCLLSHRRTALNKVIETHRTAPVSRRAYLGNACYCGKMDRNYLGNSAELLAPQCQSTSFLYTPPPTSVTTMASSTSHVYSP